jgi:DNA helicase II / ATP-dependent DNA helicase PcrA
VSDLLSHLNEQQQAAVLHPEGPALVLAGAGSGKTTVLTTRAAWLLKEKKLAPHQILLVTFTNKAANEIKERVLELTESTLPFAGTFHSLSAKILRIDGEEIGLDRNFVIYDTDDQASLLKNIYSTHNFDQKRFKIPAVKAVISTAKNELITASEYEQFAQGDFQTHAAKVYHLYERELRKAQAVDFDDLLLRVLELFERAPAVLSKYQEQLQHVLVDEYQDTNKAQYKITKLLSHPHNNLFAVGDFSQSIYAWRGADYRNMLLLQQDFKEIHEYQLDRNYRSTQIILDAATQVISHNKSHPILHLWTDNTATDKISISENLSAEDEARGVVAAIRSHKRNYLLSDMAILYRTNAQSRPFEEALIRSSIPYRLIGGTKFYERKEVKDLIAYLRLLINPSDIVSEQRVLKLGKRRYQQFLDWKPVGMSALQKEECQIVDILKGILDATAYTKKFNKENEDDLSRLENIQEFLAVSTQFATISEFLENIALLQNEYFANGQTQVAEENMINLMSLHAAKGLEFSVVFVAGMEEGLFPHSRSLLDVEQMEEERRLCYVGITRAKQHLHLSYAKSRFMYGSTSRSTKSRFLSDINPDLVAFHSTDPGHTSWQENTRSTGGRRLVVEDEMLNDILSGDLDIEALIER